MAKKWMTLGMVPVLLTVGWVGFYQAFVQMNRIPGSPSGVVIGALAPAESLDTVAFAVIGDAGTGGRDRYRIAEDMAESFSQRPFRFLLTTGDNVYFGDVVERASEVIDRPYGPLFDAGVEFRPALGNHDLDEQADMPEVLAALGMSERYYRFTSGPVDFFAVDSNRLDGDQRRWLMEGLSCSENKWQVVYLHHPLYSSGKHGSDTALRESIEPVLVAGGADIVFAGHDHNYERTTPQHGIVHVVTGGGGAHIRPVGTSDFTAVSEADHHFVFARVANGTMQVTAFEAGGDLLDAFAVSPRPAQAQCAERRYA